MVYTKVSQNITCAVVPVPGTQKVPVPGAQKSGTRTGYRVTW